ncbi:MAG TPA: hypothetical protein VFE46_10740 [Pirellulales bacterium]|jgi:hypothetical protein|nr:hypothetical protein [Pirellulales bacterium]
MRYVVLNKNHSRPGADRLTILFYFMLLAISAGCSSPDSQSNDDLDLRIKITDKLNGVILQNPFGLFTVEDGRIYCDAVPAYNRVLTHEEIQYAWSGKGGPYLKRDILKAIQELNPIPQSKDLLPNLTAAKLLDALAGDKLEFHDIVNQLEVAESISKIVGGKRIPKTRLQDLILMSNGSSASDLQSRWTLAGEWWPKFLMWEKTNREVVANAFH